MADFAKVAFPAFAAPQMREGTGWLRRLNWNIGFFKRISSFQYSNIPLFRHLFSNARILESSWHIILKVFWTPMFRVHT
jgi:hypothetical protein